MLTKIIALNKRFILNKAAIFAKIGSIFCDQETILGIDLDLNSSSVRLVELAGNKNNFFIKTAAIESISSEYNAKDNNNIPDISILTDTLIQALKNSKTQCTQAAIAIPSKSVMTRLITIPAQLTDEEILERIEFDADHYFPYPLEEMYFDFECLNTLQNTANDPKTNKQAKIEHQEILLASAKKDKVDPYLQVLYQAGLNPAFVESEALALERSNNTLLTQLAESSFNENALNFTLALCLSLRAFTNEKRYY